MPDPLADPPVRPAPAPGPAAESPGAAQGALLRVFVVGCSRGGTTLAQRLIAERLDLLTLPETRVLANVVGDLEPRMFPRTARALPPLRRARARARVALGLATGAPPVALPGTLEMAPRRWRRVGAVMAAFAARMDAAARAGGRAGWLEKTPFHVHYAPEIARHVPGAWTIHVVREARAVIGSIRDAARRYDDPWPLVYDRVERDVDNWNASAADSAAMVGRPRQVFVPYEALAAAPDAVLDRIADRIRGDTIPARDTVPARGTAPAGDAAPARSAASVDDAAPAGDAALAGGAAPSALAAPGGREAWKAAAVSGAVRPAASKWDSALSADERARAAALIRPLPPALEAALAPLRAAAGTAAGTGAVPGAGAATGMATGSDSGSGAGAPPAARTAS